VAELLHFFRTDSTAGGDGTGDTTTGATRAFPSLNAGYAHGAASHSDLTATPDVFRLRCTTAGQDTTTATLSGFTTSAAGYILTECTGAARHNGISRSKSSAGYQLLASNDGLRLSEDYVRFVGIELGTSGSSPQAMDSQAVGATSDIRFDECLFVCTNATVGSAFIFDSVATQTMTLTNCLGIASGHRGVDIRNAVTTMDHCGWAVSGQYAVAANAQNTITNTWAIGATTEDWWTGGTAPSGSHNASQDASVSTDYSNSVASITPSSEFTNPTAVPSTADFTLLDGSLDAVGTGSETLDITGASRTGTADIGPFNFAGGGFVPYPNPRYGMDGGNQAMSGGMQ